MAPKCTTWAPSTARVELSTLYDMSVTGDYTVTYAAGLTHLFAARPPARHALVAPGDGQIDA